MNETDRIVMSAKLGDQELVFETGVIAQLADGAVVARQGETVVLAAVVSSREPREDADFFPLTVDYREKFASAGRIPGGYFRREARATEGEILTSRLIDRTLRPLFPEGYLNDTQITVTVLSYDPGSDLGVLAINAATMALFCSDIPWKGPVAAVRAIRIGDRLTTVRHDLAGEEIKVDLLISVSRDGLVMMEGQAREASDEEIVSAILFAQSEAEMLLDVQEKLADQNGVGIRDWQACTIPQHLIDNVEELTIEKLGSISTMTGKRDRRRLEEDALKGVVQQLAESASSLAIESAFSKVRKKALRDTILQSGTRSDGRAFNEVRPIHGGAGWLPRAHGSSIFTRGETQAVVTCTLGTGREELVGETLDGAVKQPFFLHYNFPSYSVGETRPSRGPGRREIGHGNLARRALEPVMPSPDVFPYTIRIDSEITQSNGSSSMATVCGATLALMDAGVPLKRSVAGVAMGLIAANGQTVILTDILGDEDHAGDMDFKVAGTTKGVTAIQMDNKMGALPEDVLAEAFARAREARLHVLNRMASMLPSPRNDVGDRAPRVERLKIRPNRIRELIGPSGRTIQDLQNTTGAKIDIEKDGMLTIYAQDAPSLRRALRRIQELTGEAEVGKVYKGTVAGVKDFGAFIRLFGSVEGFLAPEELSTGRPEYGAEILVRVLGVNERGKIELSARAAEGVDSSDVISF